MSSTFDTLFGRNPNDPERFRGEDGGPFPEGYPPTGNTMTEEELAEAQRECEEVEAMYAGEAAHAAEIDAKFAADKAEVLEFLTMCHGGDDCEGECPAPVEVVEVHSASKVNGRVEATVRCEDGSTRRVKALYVEYGGSYMEPPDCDVEYEYVG
jgi:hypothetical protein